MLNRRRIYSFVNDSDDPDKLSLKRISALLLVTCLVVVVIANMFFNKNIDEFIFDGLAEAVIWSLGFIGVEKFSNSFNNNQNGNRNTQRRRQQSDKSDNNDTEDDMI